MNSKKLKRAALRRRSHVRKKVVGTPERPRLSVFRSNRQIYAQIIDDTAGATLVSACSLVSASRGKAAGGGNKKEAEKIGEAIAKQAMSVGIKCVCFDRGSYRFHGRIKALAEAARKAGLVF